MKSRYGVGRDWPFDYDELEPYYGQAEELMAVAGDSVDTPFRRSSPYPLPAHTFNEPEKLLKKAWPEQFFHQPSARPTAAVNRRPRCCANGVCGRCPIDSKFTVLNGFKSVFEDRRVKLEIGAAVQSVETAAGRATGVVYQRGGREQRAAANLVALGANAMFNAHILLRSSLPQGGVGKRLHEQASVRVYIDLDGVDNFQGSSSITGHGYMLYDGEHRRDRAACLVETWNVPRLRMTPGKHRQFLQAQFLYDNLPRDDNRVIVDPADRTKPKLIWRGRSDYADRSRKQAMQDAEKVFAALPIERLRLENDGAFRDTEGHILGTTPMGTDPAKSVVDGDLRHHQVRNLLVLGGSTFPVSSPSNPTLTISALSLRAASRLF
jgi:choline dehydrogenase-like flavoprotein